MNNNNVGIAKKLAAFAHLLYERGFLVFAFFAMVFAMALDDTEAEHSRRSTLNLPENSASIYDDALSSSLDANWLAHKAESLALILSQDGIKNAAVYHRVKSPQSAHEKALRQHKSATELNDLYGMRIVVDNELDVYRCLADICSSFEIIPNTLKNYIAHPKASGYQSIHIVAKMDNRRVEFQLRTTAMHLASEAEHEAYKQRVRVA